MNRLRLCLGTMITAAVLLLLAGAMAEIRINEVMASNGVYQDGHAYDWADCITTERRYRWPDGI